MRSSKLDKSREEVALEKLQQQFQSIKGIYQTYDLHFLIVTILKRNFAYGQIALVDDVVRPYLDQNKSLVLAGSKDQMIRELKGMISHDDFLKDYPGHSTYADGSQYYYKQMVSFVPEMACNYAANVKNGCLAAIKSDNDLISGWIAQKKFATFTNFTAILKLLTDLHEQDQQMIKSCESLRIIPDLNSHLTLKLARQFTATIDDEVKLAAVIKLLPESEANAFAAHVRRNWPVLTAPAAPSLRKGFALFQDGVSVSVGDNGEVHLSRLDRP